MSHQHFQSHPNSQSYSNSQPQYRFNQVKLECKNVYHVIGDVKGEKFSLGYYQDFSDARDVCKKYASPPDRKSEMETIKGLVVNDMYLYIEETQELLPLFHDDLSNLKEQIVKKLKKLRDSASTKLTLEERNALGL